jgi:hypothetical protein
MGTKVQSASRSKMRHKKKREECIHDLIPAHRNIQLMHALPFDSAQNVVFLTQRPHTSQQQQLAKGHVQRRAHQATSTSSAASSSSSKSGQREQRLVRHAASGSAVRASREVIDKKDSVCKGRANQVVQLRKRKRRDVQGE